MKQIVLGVTTLCLLIGGREASAQQLMITPQITQERGADTLIRYQDLTRFGPWDDRNYQLTRADIALLSPDEDQLRDPIPVFFRVELRRNYPNLPTTGPAQYPRSALQIFMREYGGYLIDNTRYRRLTLEAGEYRFFAADTGTTAERGQPANRLLQGEVRVTSPTGAAESAIKVSPADSNMVIAGSNGPGGIQQRMHYSTDGGDTWTQVDLPLGNTCCDPTVDWSSDGSLAYAATLGGGGLAGLGVWFYRSDDNGQTWTDLQDVTPGDPRRELTNAGSDKEYLHVDKAAGSQCLDNVYLTWHESNVMQFARSTNNGNTWTTTSFGADPLGIGSDIVTDRNGTIYYFWPGTNARQILLKTSTNCGATFGAGTVIVANTRGAYDFPIPSIETRRAWIYVSADADLSGGAYGGSVYVAWADTYSADGNTAANNHTRVQVGFSRDAGATWTVVTAHETADSLTVDRWNPWLAVGPSGQVHVVFYDTRNSANRSGVDLYHVYSNTGAQTFSTPRRLTTVTSANLGDSFEFGDYNGLDYLMAEKFIAIYTDNRDEGAGGGDSDDIYAVTTPSPSRPVCCTGGRAAALTLLPIFGAGWWRRRRRPKRS